MGSESASRPAKYPWLDWQAYGGVEAFTLGRNQLMSVRAMSGLWRGQVALVLGKDGVRSNGIYIGGSGFLRCLDR